MMKFIKNLSKTLAVTVIFLGFALQANAQSHVIVTGVDVNLRTSPTTAADNILKDAKGKAIHPVKGEILECKGSSKGFNHVVYNGLDCYISKQFSKSYSTQAIENNAPRKVVVTGTHVRLRLGPSVDYKALSYNNGTPIYPDKGEVLKCSGEKGGFYKVEYNNQVVYISKKYAKPFRK